MTVVLGLDISTSCVGITIVERCGQTLSDIILLDYVDFKGCKTIWEKVDKMKQYFANLHYDVSEIYVEDPAKKFSKGMSSATTIVTLARFNGLVSYLVRKQFNVDPEYIAPGQARKACGLKMQQKKKCGLSHKEQTFKAIMTTDLTHITWPTKRRNANKIVDYAYDIVDSYVIAKAGIRLFNIQ